MSHNQKPLYYVLGRHASVDAMMCGAPQDLILSTDDVNQSPLLFHSEADAMEYFHNHSGSKSMSELRAFIREASTDEIQRGTLAK